MDRIQQRFDELEEEAKNIDGHIGGPQPDGSIAVIVGKLHPSILEARVKQWRLSCITLLDRVFGKATNTYKEFVEYSDFFESSPDFFRFLLPIFRSAKAEYEGGYLFDIRNLVHAEVFSDELEQAGHFLHSGYEVAAAVTTGVVLETTIKKLCDQHAICVKDQNGKDIQTDTLISDLKKANAYNEAVTKQLRAWMGVRNDAAHGKRKDGDFEQGEVSRMIQGVGDFVAKQMS